MAELIVRRRAAWWQDRMRDYIVLVDVDVPEGVAQVLDCGPNATPLTALFYVIFRSGRYLTLQPGARGEAVPDLRGAGTPALS
jgi:hypothetical protein